MSTLGTHGGGCGGEVVLIQRRLSGYRLCIACGKRGVEVGLVEEQPVVKPTEKVTLSRKVCAFQYASKLKLGHIIDSKEEQATEPFGIYIQQAFIHYGIDIEKVIGGWKVVKRVEVE